VADIFVSYTSSDRGWAFWIGQQLETLGHTAHLHDWEISGGGNIMAWMDERHDKADQVLCVVSKRYLQQPYSALERHGAQWAAVSKRPNFLLPVFVELCDAPSLFAPLKRCDLHGLNEEEARVQLAEFLKPAAKPTSMVPFPGAEKSGVISSASPPAAPVEFPGNNDSKKRTAISNIPIAVPLHFLGRDDEMVAIDVALKRNHGRVAITALHGLRGVGKTTLAVAYAERRAGDYRATWWIRAETESTMRADLVGLGVRLGWVAADEKEEPALAASMDRLRDSGDGILLVYDNARSASEIRPYMPRIGAAHAIVTSNAPDRGGVAAPVEIEVWPNEVGADYLIARTGRDQERAPALTLSEALGGLPLAHEQAAAYCERIGISFVEYLSRFNAAPAKLLDAEKDAPADYHDRMTVAKTFSLAIDEAAKLHPAAELLIVYAALLAAEPIPLYLFSEAREKFGDPLGSLLMGDGLDEAAAALRAFALVDREPVADERDSALLTDCIRLHRLVREVAATRCKGEAAAHARRELIGAMAVFYPDSVFDDPKAWPRARRLDPLGVALVAADREIPPGAEAVAASVLNGLACYRVGALATYRDARLLLERALAMDEKVLGLGHSDTARSLNNLGYLLRLQGDLVGALPFYKRALAIREKALGPDHPATATSLNNLGALLEVQGDLAGALPFFTRALAIREKTLGPDHPATATSLSNLGALLQAQGDLPGARPFYTRALAIHEKVLGPDHPDTATSLNNLGYLLRAQGDIAEARSCYTRALAIREQALGPDHPDTAASLINLGYLLWGQGDLAGARLFYTRALEVQEKVLGPDHPDIAPTLGNLGGLLKAQGDLAGARAHLERALAICEKARGPDHPDTAISLNSLGGLFFLQRKFPMAQQHFQRALGIVEKSFGSAHPTTRSAANNLAQALQKLGYTQQLKALRKTYGIKK
jgi:tetratricopeptide (TPR) repeat protein